MKKIKLWQLMLVFITLLMVSGCQTESKKQGVVESTIENSSSIEENEPKKETKVNWPFYEISKDQKIKGYLLGTIHIGKREMYPFNDKIRTSLEKSHYLMTEVELEKLNDPDLNSVFSALESDHPLVDDMTKKTRKLFEKRLKDYGYTLNDMKYLNRLGVEQMLQIKYTTVRDSTFGVESELSRQLKKMPDVKNIGFETVEEQFDLLNEAYKEPKDIAKWVEQIPTLKEQKKATKEILDLYIKGKVFEVFSEKQFSETEKIQHEIIVNKRNQNWMKVLPKYLEEDSPVFVAVGAGHLPMDVGLINLLEKQGYEVKKVSFQ